MCVNSLKIDAKILGIPEEFKGTGNIRRWRTAPSCTATRCGNARSYRDTGLLNETFSSRPNATYKQTEKTCVSIFKLGKLCGFTLVELLVVIAIIGIFIGLPQPFVRCVYRLKQTESKSATK